MGLTPRMAREARHSPFPGQGSGGCRLEKCGVRE